MDKIVQAMADELASNFFRVYIMKGDTDLRWEVECDYRQGHDEHLSPVLGYGATIEAAIIHTYAAWKKIDL